MNDIGNKIKELRIKNKLSQQELANLLYVSNKTISSWENNRTIPDINFIFKLCDIFHTSFYSLVDNEYCNLNNIELEIKLKVDFNEWKRILNFVENTSSHIGKFKQQDIYFCPNFRNFEKEWLRLRNENGKYIFSYKNLIEKNACKEYETIIDDAKNFEKILCCLNFKKVGIINKERDKYLYNKKYEFSFDSVEKIGLFIEIEIKKSIENFEEEYTDLIKLLNQLKIDISSIDCKRYFDYLIKED